MFGNKQLWFFLSEEIPTLNTFETARHIYDGYTGLGQKKLYP